MRIVEVERTLFSNKRKNTSTSYRVEVGEVAKNDIIRLKIKKYKNESVYFLAEFIGEDLFGKKRFHFKSFYSDGLINILFTTVKPMLIRLPEK